MVNKSIKHDDMIGIWNAANKVVAFPKFNLAGQIYSRPTSTLNLKNGKFCVLVSGMTKEDREKKVSELETHIAKKSNK